MDLSRFIGVPNHVHALISFISTGQSINTIIGNGKRFMPEPLKYLGEQKTFNPQCALLLDVGNKRLETFIEV